MRIATSSSSLLLLGIIIVVVAVIQPFQLLSCFCLAYPGAGFYGDGVRSTDCAVGFCPIQPAAVRSQDERSSTGPRCPHWYRLNRDMCVPTPELCYEAWKHRLFCTTDERYNNNYQQRQLGYGWADCPASSKERRSRTESVIYEVAILLSLL